MNNDKSMIGKRVLVLQSAGDKSAEAANKQFVDNVNAASGGLYHCTYLHYKDVVFLIDNGNVHASILQSNEPITEFDLVYFKKFIGCQEQAYALAQVLKAAGIPLICSEVLEGVSSTKLSQYVKLALAGLPLPKTLYVHTDRLETSFAIFQEKLGVPFVIKAIDGRGGEANYVVRTQQDFAEIPLRHPGTDFVAQSFINNDADYRVITLDYEVKLIIRRQRNDDSTHLNNTSQGAEATLIGLQDISEADRRLCADAARAMNREVAGVDLMYELETGKPYILEVNASPQLGSGAYTDEKTAVFDTYLRTLLDI